MGHDAAQLVGEYKTMYTFLRGLRLNTLVVPPDDVTRIKYNSHAKPGDDDYLLLESLSRTNEPVVVRFGLSCPLLMRYLSSLGHPRTHSALPYSYWRFLCRIL